VETVHVEWSARALSSKAKPTVLFLFGRKVANKRNRTWTSQCHYAIKRAILRYNTNMVVIRQRFKSDLWKRDWFTWKGKRGASSFLLYMEWSIDLVQPASDAEWSSGGGVACPPLCTEEAHIHKMSRGHITLQCTQLVQLCMKVVCHTHAPLTWLHSATKTTMSSLLKHTLQSSGLEFGRFAD
jgi:hypothetical protein